MQPIASINKPDTKQRVLNSTVKADSFDTKQNVKTIKPIDKYASSVIFHSSLVILHLLQCFSCFNDRVRDHINSKFIPFSRVSFFPYADRKEYT